MREHSLYGIFKEFGLQMFDLSHNNDKVMDFHRADSIQAEIVVNYTVLEKVSSFEYLNYDVSYIPENGVNELYKFNRMCGRIWRTVK